MHKLNAYKRCLNFLFKAQSITQDDSTDRIKIEISSRLFNQCLILSIIELEIKTVNSVKHSTNSYYSISSIEITNCSISRIFITSVAAITQSPFVKSDKKKVNSPSPVWLNCFGTALLHIGLIKALSRLTDFS